MKFIRTGLRAMPGPIAACSLAMLLLLLLPSEPQAADVPAHNLTANPSFETGTHGWEPSHARIARVLDLEAPDGGYVAEISSRILDLQMNYGIGDSPATVASAAAGTYRAGAFLRADRPSEGLTAFLTIVETGPDGEEIGESAGSVALSASEYREVAVEREVSAGSTLELRIQVPVSSILANVLDLSLDRGSFRADAITLVEIDDQAPPAPQLAETDPVSPADDPEPLIIGEAEPGSTVDIFGSDDCTGSPSASGTAEQFGGTGIPVPVEEESTTPLSATATDEGGNRSSCSGSVSYTEQSTVATCSSQFGIEGEAGCNTVLAEDPMTDPDPTAIWGGRLACDLEAESADGTPRQALRSGDGDHHARATGDPQEDTSYRGFTVVDGDDYWGERCEVGNNEHRYGEGGGSGTFQLYNEGQRKLTYASIRLPGDYPLADPNWQVLLQMKQAQPADNGSGTPVLALEARDGRWQLLQSTSNGPAGNTQTIWDAPAEVGVWTRFAFDISYSSDPTKGQLRVLVDLNGDGDVLDAHEQSEPINTYTLKYETAGSESDGIAEGESIPSHLRAGTYHNPIIDCPAPAGCRVDVDNVQILGRNGPLDDVEPPTTEEPPTTDGGGKGKGKNKGGGDTGDGGSGGGDTGGKGKGKGKNR